MNVKIEIIKVVSFLNLIITIEKNNNLNFFLGDFKDFRIFFHSKPIPDLYLKRFKSYSLSKLTTLFSKPFYSIWLLIE